MELPQDFNELDRNGTLAPFHHDLPFRHALGIASLFMGFIGVIFNLITIMAVAKGSKIGEVKIQIINLAVADLLSALVVPISNFYGLWPFNFPVTNHHIFCKIFRFVGYGAFQTSPLWNMAIGLERLVIIYFPLKARGYRRKHKIIVAALVWIVGFFPGIESLLYVEVVHEVGSDGTLNVCRLNSDFYRYHETIDNAIKSVRYFTPGIVITITYILIGFKLCMKARVGERGSFKQERQMLSRKSQVLQMLMIDSIVTLISWMPYSIYFLSIKDEISVRELYGYANAERITKSLGALRLTNVFSSPVIYFFFNKAFRDDLKTFMKDPCSRRTVPKARRFSAFSSSRSTSISTITIQQYALPEQKESLN